MSTALFLIVSLLISAPGPAAARYTMRARRVRRSPNVDGYLSDACWKAIKPISSFTQYSPYEGAPSQEKTFVYCVYDASSIYFAFVCLDSDYQGINTRLTPRESAQMGDCVALFLDTFHDRQNAYLFQTNARGIQLDARVSEGGARMDNTWDGVWYAEGRVTTKGWVVEMEIPFRTLRYPFSSIQVWGVQFWRYIERLDETSYWVPVSRREGFGVCRFGQLLGIKNTEHGLHVEALPYVMARGEMSPVTYLDTTGAAAESVAVEPEFDLGMDLKWGLASDLTIDATLNPDFSQVEADPEYINLSRYEHYLPEKRPFFLEGSDLLATPYQIFYSRRVGRVLADSTEVPILGGTRVTGKAYNTSFLISAAATEGVSTEPPALYSVGRIKWDILKSSNLGFLAAAKDTSKGYARCIAFDSNLRLLSHLDLSTQLARSWNKNPGLEGYLGKGSANFHSADWSIGADYSDIDSTFYVEDFGYVPWFGTRSYNSWFTYHPWPNVLGIRTCSISLRSSGDKRYENPVWSSYVGPYFSVTFANRWQPWVGAYFGDKYEEGAEKPYTDVYCGVVSDYRRAVAFTFYARQYDSYNYAKAYFGHIRTGYTELQLKPAGNIQLDLRLESVTEYTEEWSLDESSWISSQRLKVSLTRDWHIRAYGLENTHNKRYTLNGLIEWEFAPKSRVLFAFNEVRDNSEGDWALSDRIGFVKISYLLAL